MRLIETRTGLKGRARSIAEQGAYLFHHDRARADCSAKSAGHSLQTTDNPYRCGNCVSGAIRANRVSIGSTST
jgi:hypothetical protein